jgi:hypothetical protein
MARRKNPTAAQVTSDLGGVSPEAFEEASRNGF